MEIQQKMILFEDHSLARGYKCFDLKIEAMFSSETGSIGFSMER
jgi:hypothetical protein